MFFTICLKRFKGTVSEMNFFSKTFNIRLPLILKMSTVLFLASLCR
jgi:hypothetical protein